MHAVEWAVRPYPARVGGGTRCTAGFPIRARAPPACVHPSPGAVGRTLGWRWPSTHDLHSNIVSPVSLLLSGSRPTTSDSGPRACVGSGSFALLSCFVSRDSLLLLPVVLSFEFWPLHCHLRSQIRAFGQAPPFYLHSDGCLVSLPRCSHMPGPRILFCVFARAELIAGLPIRQMGPDFFVDGSVGQRLTFQQRTSHFTFTE